MVGFDFYFFNACGNQHFYENILTKCSSLSSIKINFFFALAEEFNCYI